MSRPRRNLFYPLLGIVGFAFTITAASFCVSVLRGVRPETSREEPHPLQRLMDRHGTSILVGELVVLAIATVGAVGLDHIEGERKDSPVNGGVAASTAPQGITMASQSGSVGTLNIGGFGTTTRRGRSTLPPSPSVPAPARSAAASLWRPARNLFSV